MNYYRIELKTNKYAYSLTEFSPLSEDVIEDLKEISSNTFLQESVGKMLAQLYKDELAFKFQDISKFEFIYPIKIKNDFFSDLNKKIVSIISKELNLEIIDDYFIEENKLFSDDKNNHQKNDALDTKINLEYKNIPIIIFNCCCTTGFIFDEISKNETANKDNLYLCYGIKHNANLIKNSRISQIEYYDFSPKEEAQDKEGFFIRIYGLFGYKNIEVDLRNDFAICIGENGFGKSTAMEIAALVMKILKGKKDNLFVLSKYFFKKVEVYHSQWYYDFEKNNNFNEEKIDLNVNDRVLSKEFGNGCVLDVCESDPANCTILFDDEKYGIKKIPLNTLRKIDSNCNIQIKKHIISFYDKKGLCFNKQIIEDNKFIDKKIFEKLGLLENEIINKLVNKPIFDSMDIHLKEYFFDYGAVKKIGKIVTYLERKIEYSNVIPSKKEIISNIDDIDVHTFLNIINDEEYNTIVRKTIIEDRSIEIDYGEIAQKYKMEVNYNTIDDSLRKMLKDLVILKNDCLFESDRDFPHPFDNYAVPFLYNCAKDRKLSSIMPRNRIHLNYFKEDFNKNKFEDNRPILTYEKYIREINKRVNEKQDDNNEFDENNDPFNFGFFDKEQNDILEEEEESKRIHKESRIYWAFSTITNTPEGEWNPERVQRECYSSIEKIYCTAQKNVGISFSTLKKDDKGDEEYLLKDTISTKKMLSYLHYFLLRHQTTTIPIIIKKIFYYDELSYEDDNILIEPDVETIVIDKTKLLSVHNIKKVEKMYNNIINDYGYINYGIYDLIDDNDYVRLSKIINRLRVNGLKDDRDYLVVVGIKAIIDEYKSIITNQKTYLLEKLINKYLINKRANIYLDTIVITDSEGRIIPLNNLSTGERKIIVLFNLCLQESHGLIILDEPDLSMSVEWQSKFLVDLLKYTDNRYIIVSQSPLLIQNNNLSCYVKRMDFDSTYDKLINYDKIISYNKKMKDHFFDIDQWRKK